MHRLNPTVGAKLGLGLRLGPGHAALPRQLLLLTTRKKILPVPKFSTRQLSNSTKTNGTETTEIQGALKEGAKYVVGTVVSSFTESLAFYVAAFGAASVCIYFALTSVSNYGNGLVENTKVAVKDKVSASKEIVVGKMNETKESINSALNRAKQAAQDTDVSGALGDIKASGVGVIERARDKVSGAMRTENALEGPPSVVKPEVKDNRVDMIQRAVSGKYNAAREKVKSIWNAKPKGGGPADSS